MWVKFKQTYTSEAGIFLKDCKYDLFKSQLKNIPAKMHKKCRAPWDEHKKTVKKKAKNNSQEKEIETPKDNSQKKEIETPKDKQMRPGRDKNYRTK